jgi:hypothetical protein
MVEHDRGHDSGGEWGHGQHAGPRHGHEPRGSEHERQGQDDRQRPGRPDDAAGGTRHETGTRDTGGHETGTTARHETGARDPRARDATGPARMVRLISGAHQLTINPVDGSEVQPCPPAEAPGTPVKLPADQRPAPGRAAVPAGGTPAGAYAVPLLERDDERERLARDLASGLSLRLTGPSGAGRSSLLDAVAEDVAGIAPDAVVRLNGYHRTQADLLYDLFAAVYDTRGYRPEGEELRAALREIGAIVIVDDLEFGGAALDEFLDAAPECAFLFAAAPDAPALSSLCPLVDVPLAGLSRTACLELLEHAARRPLTDAEADWATDLWFAPEGQPDEQFGAQFEGLPLRFVRAGALLRRLGPHGRADAEVGTGEGEGAPPSRSGMAARIADSLPAASREVLRVAVALDGELPHHTHLPALTGDPGAGEATTELAADGLITAAGAHYRLAAGVAAELTAAGYAEGAGARALVVAQHYGWWTGHPSVTPQRVAVESDAVHAAVQATRRAGNASTAVLLARTAAPVLAASLWWSAWERLLRGGQEAARTAGEVAQEAYFHHELGVLALCVGQLERAGGELEASIALRGVLADQRGTVAGRRALALLTDLITAEATGTAGARELAAPDRSPVDPESGAEESRFGESRFGGSGFGESGFDESVRVGSVREGPVPGEDVDAGSAGGRSVFEGVASSTVAATLANPADSGTTGRTGSGVRAGRGGQGQGRGRRALRGRRRNVAMAGAGAVLAAALGAVVTLGNVAHQDATPASGARPDHTSGQQDNGNEDLTVGEPRGSDAGGNRTASRTPDGRGGQGEPGATSRAPTSRAPGGSPSAKPTGSGPGSSKPGSSGESSPGQGGSKPGSGSPSPSHPGGTGGTSGTSSGSPSTGGSSDGASGGGNGGSDGGSTGGGAGGGTSDGGGSGGSGGSSDGGSTGGSPSPSGGSTSPSASQSQSPAQSASSSPSSSPSPAG